MQTSAKIIIGAIPVVITAGLVGYVYLYDKPKLVKSALELTELKFADRYKGAKLSENPYKEEQWKKVYKNMNYLTLKTVIKAMEVTKAVEIPDYLAKLKKHEYNLDKSGFTKAVEKNNGLPIQI